MSLRHVVRARSQAAAAAAALGILACSGMEPPPAPEPAAADAAPAGGRAALIASLPRPADLPPGYRPAGELAGRGTFHAAGGQFTVRDHDGGHYHGYDGPGVWAKEPKGIRTQGVVYGVEDDAVTTAGYLLPQVDLTAGRSFHGLTLRELDFPAARAMTVDLIEGETPESNRYLLLWHFLPPEGVTPPPMLSRLDLPPVTTLPPVFTVYACEQYPDAFCPGMGRHYTDPSNPAGRLPTSTGNDGVIYGEAAGKLIFIEYVLTQEDLAAGVSWPAMPLDDLPIPPIDNVHVLHFGSEPTSGRYTVHMYFLPEETYLAWKTEPDTL